MNFTTTGVLALALLCLAATANAATDSTTFNVKLTITSTCDIHTTAATDVDFGSRPSTATNIDSQGQLVVNCTPDTGYTIALNKGSNGTDVNSRKMKSGSNLVPYQIYKADTRTAADVWGETSGTSGNVLSSSGTGANQNIPVYGRVPSANFPAGDYSDVITATVSY